MEKKEYDAIVVGSGPNGLSAAITMQQQGLSVLLIEGAKTIGGGMRTKEYVPGFRHDICSAIHPMAVASFFFKKLPLESFGLKWIYSDFEMAHPFEDGHVALLKRSVVETAETLGRDKQAYIDLMQEPVEEWYLFAKDILGPLQFPSHPIALSKFGLKAIQPAAMLVNRFQDKYAKGIFAGLAAHSMLPLENITTSAIGLVLSIAGHRGGWPMPEGGSQQFANALHQYFTSLGGVTQVDWFVKSMKELPSAHAVLFDVTPQQLLEIAGAQFSEFYKWQLKKFKYGIGVFKVDFELKDKIPYSAPLCLKAATVHLGSTYDEIADAERAPHEGRETNNPFILIAQQSLFDSTRAPQGAHTAWTYCHVPAGSTKDITGIIEDKIEKFAPGFKDLIIGKHSMGPREVEAYNPNYIGGDINGGMQDITQLFTRPVLRSSPYKTSAKGIYVCSSSTPPGGGVHGLCGYYSAKRALKDIFKISLPPL